AGALAHRVLHREVREEQVRPVDDREQHGEEEQRDEAELDRSDAPLAAPGSIAKVCHGLSPPSIRRCALRCADGPVPERGTDDILLAPKREWYETAVPNRGVS